MLFLSRETDEVKSGGKIRDFATATGAAQQNMLCSKQVPSPDTFLI